MRLLLATCATALGALAFASAPALAAAPEAPTLTVERPVHATEAVLHGVLNPGKEGEPGTYEAGSYEFLYRESKTECKGGSATTPGMSLGGGKEELPAEALTALTADTEYTVCLQIKTAGGTTVSPAVTFKTALPPETPETLKAEPVTNNTATLHGVLNPKAIGNAGTYEFLYKRSATDCEGEGSIATPAATVAGHEKEAAQAPVTGLLPNTQYTFCLLAHNEAGEASALSPPETFTTHTQAPTVEGESSSNLSSTNATVSAQVDPGGLPTTYRVEYGTSPTYGTSTPETNLGDASAAVSVAVELSKLEPATLYYFRFVVSNTLGTVSDIEDATLTTNASAPAPEVCPNAASRQGPGSALPDCRAYEQVTPVSKADATDLFPGSESAARFGLSNEGGYAAEDGEHFLLYTEASLTGGDSIQSGYVFSRGASGWAITSLSPGVGVHASRPNIFDTENLSEIGIREETLIRTPGHAEEDVETSTVGPPGGPYTTVGEGHSDVVGASADLSHLVVANQPDSLEEWFDGRLKPIAVSTNGSPISPCGANLGNGVGNNQNAMSSDGSRIIFTVPSPEGGSGAGCWNSSTEENPPELYMRIDGTSTVEISVPNRGVKPEAPQAAYYVGASADDSKVFFVTKAELTADDTTHAAELYEYDAEAPEGERLVRVSSGESGTAEGHVNYVPAISNDGSTVYFTAYGKLAEGATSGSLNLYHYDTATRKTTYISQEAPNYPEPEPDPFLTPVSANWGTELVGSGPPETSIALDPYANWATTDDGQYLLFGSTLPLTGYDNVGVFETNEFANGVDKNFPFEELFRYDAANNSLVCVSCAVGAPPPVDNATFTRGVSGIELSDAGPPRAISEDGSFAFFESQSALVPQAVPGRLHVYEWHNGKISLISSPDDTSASYFLGASADGSNVFFATHAQLVPQDTDAGGDVYDARIDGGFVGLTPAQCTGTGCQGVPGAAPIFATPSSVTFEGVGNFEPPPAVVKPKPKAKPAKCRKGFVKKKGKCVKAKAKKKAKKSNRRGK